MNRFRRGIRQSVLSAVLLTVVLVTAAYFLVDWVTSDSSSSLTTVSSAPKAGTPGAVGTGLNVAEMENAVFDYRKIHRQADLDVTTVVLNFIRTGDSTEIVERNLSAAGYKISHDQDRGRDLPDSLVAERYFCTGLNRMTGFCDSLRIIFHNSSGRIADVKAFVFFHAL